MRLLSSLNRAVALLLAVFLVVPAFASTDQLPGKLKLTELPAKYRSWLEDEVFYIISKRERDVFLRLHSDALRDLFVKLFWRRRDPVPSTPENEYRAEYQKNLAYVKEYYKILRQDRVRLYLALGKPTKITPFASSSDFFPIEVWEYEGLVDRGFPQRMTLLFFKPHGSGLYRLYSPAVDGFSALRSASRASGSMSRDLQPGRFLPNIVAEAIRGVTPGRGPFGSEQLLMDVLKPPPVNLAGVEEILTGTVSTTISYGSLPFDAIVRWYYGEDERREVSIALAVPASAIESSWYKGRAYFGLFVAGQVKVAGSGLIASEWSDQVSADLSSDEREKTTVFPFLYTYRLKLLPGRYTLNLVARDDARKRLGIKDLALTIPPVGESGYQISSPILALKFDRLEEASGNVYSPFVFDRVEILPNVRRRVSRERPLMLFFQLLRPAGSKRAGLKLRYRVKTKKSKLVTSDVTPVAAVSGVTRRQSIIKLLSLDDVGIGSYDLEIELLNSKGTVLAATVTEFTVVGGELQRGRLIARSFENEDPAGAALAAGRQLILRGKFLEAREQFRLALRNDPSNQDAKISLGRALVLSGDYREARDAMKELVAAGNAPEAYMVLGAALAGLGQEAKAVAAYERAIQFGGETIVRLNALAEACWQAGLAKKARESARRSLEIHPDQPLLKKFLEKIESANR